MIIKRYLFREIILRFIWIAVLLVLILSTNKFLDYLGDAASGKIPASFVLKLLMFRIIAMQEEIFPLILFLAVTLSFARLNQDNELVVMASAGMGKNFQLGVAMQFCLLFSILFSILVFYGAPLAEQQISNLKSIAWQEANFSALAAGKFKEIGGSKNVVYVEKLSDNKKNLRKVFLQMRDNREISILKSDSARFRTDKSSGDRYIIFNNGRRYLGNPGTMDYRITEFEKYAALIEINEETKKPDSPVRLSTLELLKGDSPEYRAEIQWRLSSIIICFILTMLGVLLNQYPFGQKPFTLLLFGIMIYFIYTNLMSISFTLLEKDRIPAYVGIWWVHALAASIVMFIYHYANIRRRIENDKNIQVLTDKE